MVYKPKATVCTNSVRDHSKVDWTILLVRKYTFVKLAFFHWIHQATLAFLYGTEWESKNARRERARGMLAE